MRTSCRICSCRGHEWMRAAAGSEHLSPASQGLLPAVMQCGRDTKTGLFLGDLGLLWRVTLSFSARDGKFECFSWNYCTCPPAGELPENNHWQWQNRKMERTWVPRDLLSCWANQPQNPSPHGLLVLQDNKFPCRVSHRVGVLFTCSRKHCHWYSYPLIPLPRRNFYNSLLWAFRVHLPTYIPFCNLIYFVTINILCTSFHVITYNLLSSFSWPHRILYRDVP